MTINPTAPTSVATLINRYVERERAAVEKWENREPLDYSGTYDLHAVAREIYSLGWGEGCQYALELQRRVSDQ